MRTPSIRPIVKRTNPIKHRAITVPIEDNSQAIRLVQITDCHLSFNPEWRLAGVKTQETFEAVLKDVAHSWPNYDLNALTGDLVHDASEEGYQRLKSQLEELPAPSVCLPGNHDLPATLNKQMDGDRVSTAKIIYIGDWLLVSLDSTIRGSERGHLKKAELDFLEETISDNQDKHTLIMLHHHPVPIGSEWMDRMALQNPELFFDIINQQSQVRGILWGHIHQAFDREMNGIKLMGTPSTCLQFVPNQGGFGIDRIAPGYRLLELKSNGNIETQVIRIPVIPQGLDLNSSGY